MRWLCFLLVSGGTALAQTAPALAPGAKQLRFDIAAIPVTRDSFVFFLDRQSRGYAVWQYERRAVETKQEVLYTARSEFAPIEMEELRVVLDALTGRPVHAFHRIELSSPASDTTLLEYDLSLHGDSIEGRRRTGRRSGEIGITPVHATLPTGGVLSDFELYAAGVTNATPGDSLVVPAYSEFGDSVARLTMIAEQPTTIQVPAGKVDVLPLRSGNFRLYVTRTAPRRVVKGTTLDGRFSFELAHSAPAVPSQP